MCRVVKVFFATCLKKKKKKEGNSLEVKSEHLPDECFCIAKKHTFQHENTDPITEQVGWRHFSFIHIESGFLIEGKDMGALSAFSVVLLLCFLDDFTMTSLFYTHRRAAASCDYIQHSISIMVALN